MASTPAGICNIALARIGHRQFIAELTDRTTEARVATVHYDDAVQAVLASAPWNFATRRALLAELTDHTRSGWEFVYSLPADCITARYLYSGLNSPAVDQRPAFNIEMNDTATAKVLVTNREQAELVYTSLVTEAPMFPPLFTQALAWRLAADFALALPVKASVGLEMEKGYSQALRMAAATEFQQSQSEQPQDSEFIRERW